MGRLIDADKLNRKDVNCANVPMNFIDTAPTVEAIPKADYEAKLKADMVAILTELQLEIEDCVDGGEGSPQFEQGVDIARCQVVDIIQQKIDEMSMYKEKKDE